MRHYRFRYSREDAADGCELVVAVPLPPWWCDCGTKNEGREWYCIYCGSEREDIEACESETL
jgi:hypothetical protein